MTCLRLKRVYDAPTPQDGARILVDRLWPRGLTRESAALDDWAKAVSPSNDLRRWAHAQPEIPGGGEPPFWNEFRARYRAELTTPEGAAALDALRARIAAGPTTLLFAAKDTAHNNATVLAEFLREK